MLFVPMLSALASVLLAEARTGKVADPVLVDRVSGRPLSEHEYAFVPGPAASERTRRRLGFPGARGIDVHKKERTRGEGIAPIRERKTPNLPG